MSTPYTQADIARLNPGRIERMRSLLTDAFAPTALHITDDSHKHAGHAGGRDGHGHFGVRIVSAAFEGMTPLARHRAIYAALGEMMTHDIHALRIEASPPASP